MPSTGRAGRWWLGLVIALLALNWVAAVARFQVNGLCWDQWDFCAPLFRGGSWLDLFTVQHGPHRQGLAFVLTSWVMRWSQADARVDSLWIVAQLVVSAGLVLRLKRQLTGRLGWRDTWLPVAGLALLQYENVIVVPNSSHSVAPLLLLLLTSAVWLRGRDGWREPVTGGLALLATFTGFGFFVGLAWSALLALTVARRIVAREWRALGPAFVGLGVAAAGWAWFAHGYVFNPASDGYVFPHEPLTDYPRFMALMLAARFGWEAESAAAYAGGGVMLLAMMAGLGWSGGRLARGVGGRIEGVAAVMLATCLGFVAFAAVGRIHLGIDAGMVSRYTVLTFTGWLGLGAVAVAADRRWLAIGVGLAGWAMALGPLAGLSRAGGTAEPGTIGLSAAQVADMSQLENRKAQWIDVLLRTGDWREAERRVPGAMHPQPEASDFDRKIAWLRERNWSWFAEVGPARRWLPWWRAESVTWLESTGGAGDRWIGEAGRALVNPGAGTFLNVQVLHAVRELGETPTVVIELDGATAAVALTDLRAGISLPVSAAEHELTLRSPAGAFPLNPPADTRRGAFFVGEVSRSAAPRFARWGWARSGEALQPIQAWHIVDGFWGWEADGAFGWTGAQLQVECTVLEPAFLNLRIGGRYPAVDTGPVVVVLDGAEHALSPQSAGGYAVAWAVPPDGQPHMLTLFNRAGARSPQQTGESDDGRALALKLTRLSLDEQPAGPLLGGPD